MEAIIYGAAGAVGGAITTGAAALGLSAAGFTSAGVAAGSVAAGLQAGVGNVVGGSLFAVLQSIGATGAIVGALPAAAGVGAVAGLLVLLLWDRAKMILYKVYFSIFYYSFLILIYLNHICR